MEFVRAGCRFAVDDVGAGHPVVLTHGAGADRGMFEHQVAGLVDAGFRVVSWDLRMHGSSRPSTQPITPRVAVDDLVALVGHLGLERPVLVGHSLGGNLSQAVVKQHPGLVGALAVLDSAPNHAPLSWIDRALLRLAAPSLRAIPASRLPGVMARASASTPAGIAYGERVFGAMPKRDFIAAWRTTVGLLDADPEYRTPVPLLLVRGADDRTGTIATAMPAWAAREGVDEVVVPGAGHLATVDAPDSVTAALLGFLARM